jgi:hypothetical protein
MTENIFESEIYLQLRDRAMDERRQLVKDLINVREHDEKTYLQGKIHGLSFFERIEAEFEIDLIEEELLDED